MGFLLKAGFWFGIVLLFLPKNPDALSKQRQLAQDSARSLIEAAENAAQFCQEQPKICETANQSSKLASTYISLASEQLAKQTETEQ